MITLKDCLHAPDVPINLLSVGSMVEHDLKLIFKKGSTSIFFLSLVPSLHGSSIKASVYSCLSFLFCDFVLTTSSSTCLLIAFPALISTSFPHLDITPELWHARFGHLNHDTTKTVLTKNYASEVAYDSSFTNDLCIPCILSKQPARPFNHLNHRASAICDLLHMNSCGPFPISFSNGCANHFHSILDDCSNFSSTTLLSSRTQTASHFKHVKAS